MARRKFHLGFTTLDKEGAVESLPVIGEIPAWLSGTLVRNGPAQFEAGEKKLNHWFDGFAMLHAFSFRNGRVSYANKFLETKAYRYAKENNRLGYSEFATDPCRSIFKRFAHGFFPKATDNANVNVSKIAQQFAAITEIPLPIQFDVKTLKTTGVIDYEDTIQSTTTTAHPHYDFARKEGINYLTHYSLRNKYNIYRIPENSRKRELIASMPVKEPSYMHSFGMTENYIVLAEFPFVVNPLKILLSGKPFIENFTWKPKHGTNFIVVNRKTGEYLGEYKTKSCFEFHHINAFEENENIIVDMVAYPDASIVQSLYLDVLRGETKKNPPSAGEFRRFTIIPKNHTVSSERMVEAPIELPRTNYERVNGKEYQFVYAAGSSPKQPEEFLDRLVKVDAVHRTTKVWKEVNCYPGEPVFVPAPRAKSEDEGIVLSVVLNAQNYNSLLLILDAVSFEERGRAEVPHHIPFGFHSQYFSV
jgi:beta,beta-carotene 9',10'-dioxygenase